MIQWHPIPNTHLMRLTLLLFFALVLFSCKDKKAASSLPIPRSDTGDHYQSANPDISKTLFYPVFELSPQTTAFIIPLDSLPEQVLHLGGIDSLPEKLKQHKLYDTLGAYQLIRNDSLETLIKKSFSAEYYIYGTLGMAKARVNAVVFGLDECRTNFCAFCIDKANIASIGHPVVCSDKPLDLHYSKNYGNTEKAIDRFLSKMPHDYSDSINIRVFANTGNFYFSYSDDFLWGIRPAETKCRFPARCIFKIDGDDTSRFWAESLDLFGIPCD